MSDDIAKHQIFETDYWNILLMPYQAYLGRSVILLKRYCGDLAGLMTEELLDFHLVVKKLENAFTKTFNATMFNWTCLMNNAYQHNPPDSLVHWHFRARYDHKVDFEGHIFEDPNFGYHYDRDYEKNTGKSNDEMLEKIVQALQENL